MTDKETVHITNPPLSVAHSNDLLPNNDAFIYDPLPIEDLDSDDEKQLLLLAMLKNDFELFDELRPCIPQGILPSMLLSSRRTYLTVQNARTSSH